MRNHHHPPRTVLASRASRASRAAAARPAGAAAFTLVEMLVTLGIIIILMGLLAVAVNVAYRKGDRARTAADLQALQTGLEAFKADHGHYPPVRGNDTGAQALCRALIGPGPATGVGADGKDGTGFRVRGKNYGPYVQADDFRIGDYLDPRISPASVNPANAAIYDRYNRPILYFPAFPKAVNVANNATAAAPGVGPVPAYLHSDANANGSEYSRFDADDNLAVMASGNFRAGETPGAALQRMRLLMGDVNNDGRIDTAAGEQPVEGKAFLLWSAGPDEMYGPSADDMPDRNVLDARDVEKCDDVTNFR